jgi:hypothetical protein
LGTKRLKSDLKFENLRPERIFVLTAFRNSKFNGF